MVAEAAGCFDLNQFRLWANKRCGAKWAYHLRGGAIIELGNLLAAGLGVEQFRLIVRSMLDVARLPEHYVPTLCAFWLCWGNVLRSSLYAKNHKRD